ncbi:MAG TPA: ATP-binding protein, partial [Ignisphaera sp.]|nr:ATP-binding protein [Ignisphaera sp.]
IGNRSIEYELEISVDNYIERVKIEGREALLCRGDNSQTRILSREGNYITVQRADTAPRGFLKRTIFKSILVNVPTNAAEELHILSLMLKSMAVYSFVPDSIRARSRVDAMPRLEYRGDNLARVLLHLYLEDRKKFTTIESVVQNLVPEIEEIIPHIEGTMVELWLRIKGLSEPLKPANISDGTLRILAYVTALYLGSSLVAFEEPENCIHPHLLETLVDLAHRAPCQVVITTHSPYLLDHVKPEEVYVVEKRGLETILVRLTKSNQIEAVKKFLSEGGTLGEAWYSGLIGGVPEAT